MKRRLKVLLSLFLAIAMVFSLDFSYSRVSAQDNENYLDFKDIKDRNLPFEYDGITAIGGGNGYNAVVKKGTYTVGARNADHTLKTSGQIVAEIKADIARAKSGDTIFVDGDCVVDISESIYINKPLTIASNRGDKGSDGALFRASDQFPGWDYIFNVQSDNVRISGFRLRGNKDRDRAAFGIHMYDYADASGKDIPLQNVEVDNCDISYFVLAMDIQQTPDTTVFLNENAFKIHHNYIHQNNLPNHYSDYGYGVTVNNAYPRIYANIFQNNRHDVAATGHEKNGYEAYCNIFLGDTGTQTNLDMHANRAVASDGNTMGYSAGGFMHVHHNDFRNIDPQANIYPNGKLTTLLLVDNNRFLTGAIYGRGKTAIMQDCWNRVNSPEGYGNIVAVNNIYNTSDYLGWYVQEKWSSKRTDNVIRIPSSNDLLMSAIDAKVEAGGKFLDLSQQDLDYAFGDFNGDGITDIFKTDGGKWYYLPLNTGYTDHWILINHSDAKIGTMTKIDAADTFYQYTPNLVFGNFDSDKTTDILQTTGTQWNVSYGGSTSWKTISSSALTADQMLFGKFRMSRFGKKGTAALYPTAQGMFVTDNGQSLKKVNGLSAPIAQLKTGDFSGNGKSDVFYATGSQWLISKDAKSRWKVLNNSSVDADHLVLGDFNSDGKSDVIFLNSSGIWSVSLGGKTDPIALSTGNFPLRKFRYGNFHQ